MTDPVSLANHHPPVTNLPNHRILHSSTIHIPQTLHMFQYPTNPTFTIPAAFIFHPVCIHTSHRRALQPPHFPSKFQTSSSSNYSLRTSGGLKVPVNLGAIYILDSFGYAQDYISIYIFMRSFLRLQPTQVKSSPPSFSLPLANPSNRASRRSSCCTNEHGPSEVSLCLFPTLGPTSLTLIDRGPFKTFLPASAHHKPTK